MKKCELIRTMCACLSVFFFAIIITTSGCGCEGDRGDDEWEDNDKDSTELTTEITFTETTFESVAYEIDTPAESNATGISEETTAELTSETTTTETTSDSVEDYKALLEGKWKNTETGISLDYKGLYDYFESAGTSIEYSIDGDTGGLKVTCKGETEGLSIDEYEIYVFEDKDHMKYTKVDKGTKICDSVPHVRTDE